jgi:sugar phosphate isomerase/epimerase
MVEFMDHPRFGAAWDVGHAHMDGLCHHDEIMNIGTALRAIHVHDNLGDYDAHTAPFLGSLDYDSLMRGLIDSSFKGYFTFEAERFFARERKGTLEGPLSKTPLSVKAASLTLLYEIGKSILSAYGVFEE